MCQSQPCIEELDKTAMKEEFETTKVEVEGDERDEFLGIFSSDKMLKKIAEKVMGKEFETTVTKVEEEVLHKTVGKPILRRGCSVGQFKSFQMDWGRYAEKYSSWFKAQPGEEDEHMLNDLLNSELLSCIPAPMA